LKIDTLFKSGASYNYDLSSEGLNNMYEFYKDGISLELNSSGMFKFIDMKPSDSGRYYCVITNSAVPGLMIYSRPLNLVVSSEKITGITIYPVPAKDKITIDFKDEYSGLSRIEIIKLNGELIYLNFTPERNPVIDLTQFAEGIYIVRIQTSSFYRFFKIIKN
jgi:hypothetical protein